VIGHSQTNQWFHAGGIFESLVDGAGWELLWSNGATLEDYRDPASPVWSVPIESTCANGVPVDRVVYNLGSFAYGDDLGAWSEALASTLDNIRAFHPEVRQILLQPTFGGPGEARCTIGGQPVLSSEQHALADQVIALATTGDVAPGPSPEVRACSDFRDTTGHLTTAGARAGAQQLGEYYRGQ
jgi:hypothetical protein